MATRKPYFLQDSSPPGEMPCIAAAKLAKKLAAEIIDINEDINDLSKRQTHTEGTIAKILSAFPDGDFEGHRRYHQTLIDMLEERRKLRIAIQEKTISGLVWSGIVALGALLWKGLAVWWLANIPKVGG